MILRVAQNTVTPRLNQTTPLLYANSEVALPPPLLVLPDNTGMRHLEVVQVIVKALAPQLVPLDNTGTCRQEVDPVIAKQHQPQIVPADNIGTVLPV